MKTSNLKDVLEIFAVYQQHRVMGTNDPWSSPTLMYCDKTEKDAIRDTLDGKIENDGYLEFKYTYEKINLYPSFY